MDDYIARPTEVLMAYMQWGKPPPGYDWGRLALALEVVTLIRTLERIPVVNDAERQGTIATLHTLLREQGLEDVYDAYERLAEWRRVKFVPDDFAFSPQASASAVAPAQLRQSRGDNGPSSPPVAGGRARALRDTQRELPPERRDPARDASALHEQLALPCE